MGASACAARRQSAASPRRAHSVTPRNDSRRRAAPLGGQVQLRASSAAREGMARDQSTIKRAVELAAAGRHRASAFLALVRRRCILRSHSALCIQPCAAECPSVLQRPRRKGLLDMRLRPALASLSRRASQPMSARSARLGVPLGWVERFTEAGGAGRVGGMGSGVPRDTSVIALCSARVLDQRVGRCRTRRCRPTLGSSALGSGGSLRYHCSSRSPVPPAQGG